MKLRAIAHSRTGDKGRLLNMSVIALDARDYPRIVREVTASRVRELFGALIEGDVMRYELPRIGALNFVMRRPPGESVTRTPALDPHGKSWSSALLDLEIGERS